jgi:hypothetical protein
MMNYGNSNKSRILQNFKEGKIGRPVSVFVMLGADVDILIENISPPRPQDFTCPHACTGRQFVPQIGNPVISPLGDYHGKNDRRRSGQTGRKMDKESPKPGPNGTGYFTQCKKAAHTITIDSFTANYLSSKAIADHKTPAEIIGKMVQERVAASMQSKLNTVSIWICC